MNETTNPCWSCHQGNIDAMCALLNAGAGPDITNNDDGDADLRHIGDGCSSNATLQTIMQWLNPARHYIN